MAMVGFALMLPLAARWRAEVSTPTSFGSSQLLDIKQTKRATSQTLDLFASVPLQHKSMPGSKDLALSAPTFA